MTTDDIRKLADYATAQATRGAPPIAEALRALADLYEAALTCEHPVHLLEAIQRVEAIK